MKSRFYQGIVVLQLIVICVSCKSQQGFNQLRDVQMAADNSSKVTAVIEASDDILPPSIEGQGSDERAGFLQLEFANEGIASRMVSIDMPGDDEQLNARQAALAIYVDGVEWVVDPALNSEQRRGGIVSLAEWLRIRGGADYAVDVVSDHSRGYASFQSHDQTSSSLGNPSGVADGPFTSVEQMPKFNPVIIVDHWWSFLDLNLLRAGDMGLYSPKEVEDRRKRLRQRVLDVSTSLKKKTLLGDHFIDFHHLPNPFEQMDEIQRDNDQLMDELSQGTED